MAQNNAVINKRINDLRNYMKAEEISAFMIPTSDFHGSEYTGDYFKFRQFMSGFTGSNGTLVVTAGKAGLWTDGRYFIQAEEELEGTCIDLYKMGVSGVPKITDFMCSELENGETFAFDGRVVSAAEGRSIYGKASEKGIKLRCDADPADRLWTDRPGLPDEPVYIISDELSGESALSRIGRVRKNYRDNGAEALIITKLDDIMWLLNIRGADVECNPVALSYLCIEDERICLFIDQAKLDGSVKDYLKGLGVTLYGYDFFYDFLEKEDLKSAVQADLKKINYRVFTILEKRTKLLDRPNPTEIFKSLKNDTELTNIRRVYEEDSAVLTRYIFWLKKTVKKYKDFSADAENRDDGVLKDRNAAKTEKVLDEYTAAMELDRMRSEIPGFIGLSFPTIGAYKENGAIVHYEPTPEGAKPLADEGMYLVDSGAQYLGGTTDVTRTIVLGEITEEMRKHYTLTVMGMLRLAAAVFLEGSTGRNVDICAREPLWACGLDFKHGTGHGIGYILNVHEGPQNISWSYYKNVTETPLKPGMIVSDEPGVYIGGSHGIRIENILEVVEKQKTQWGNFYGFSHLTLVPIDREAVNTEYMEERDIKLFNDYHRMVFDRISPYMETEEELALLREACSPV